MRAASDKGLGDDNQSWVVNGMARKFMHNAQSKDVKDYKCDKMWKPGDVIGLACDLDKMMHVSVNGSFAAPNGVVFKLAPDAVGVGLFAALRAPAARCASTSARRTSGTRRRPRTSRRMPRLRARPFSVPASYSHTNTQITQLRLVNPLRCSGF